MRTTSVDCRKEPFIKKGQRHGQPPRTSPTLPAHAFVYQFLKRKYVQNYGT